MINNIKTLSSPAFIYLIFGLFFLIIALIKNIINKKFNFLNTLKRTLTVVIVTYFLNWLSKMGYNNFSWFLLYFMFSIVVIALIGSFYLMNKLIDASISIKKKQTNPRS